jgi:hypothetical protein
MIFSDLPAPPEASGHIDKPCQGFAQAGNRRPPFGIMLQPMPAGDRQPAFGGASRLIRLRASMRLGSELRKKKAGMERCIADPVKSFR